MQTVLTTATADTSTAPAEFLSFRLGSEEYGIDILKVQEIRGYNLVTSIADAPEYMKGVINLRGIIVPIMDMRLRFRLANAAFDQFTVVIILNIGARVMGIVVDGVSDVVTLMPDQIKPAPALGSSLNTDYLVGMGTTGERMLILLDIDKLMSPLQMEAEQAAFAQKIAA